ncbi:hypothetical protein A2U01_0075240 [Trifolium medium]|uniref:Uncharacterized protein n=1 Tax=Trifolium medium TaxID=97028 RepID=A0A392SYT0_9FABA|nr:hypothetical protein [Trifolium medium]
MIGCCPPSALRMTASLNGGIFFLYLGDVFTIVGRRMVSTVNLVMVLVVWMGSSGGVSCLSSMVVISDFSPR